MKIRTDFITNSSSSSFIIMKDEITAKELDLIKKYIYSEENTDGWSLKEYPETFNGFTIMDNGAFWEFIRTHNIREDIFEFIDDWM